MKFQLILRRVAYGALRIVLLRQNWIIPLISSNLSLSLYIYAIDKTREINKMKYNPFCFCLDDANTKNEKMNDANTEKLRGTLKKMKITKGYDLIFEPSSDTNWCKPCDHVVMQPTIKIEIWSRKAEIGLIGVWHNENMPQGTNTIEMSRMTPRHR
jgi:hypothetical protein